jgi:hypothetical protein
VPERQGFFARWGFSHVALALLAGVVANVAAGELLPGSGVLFSLHLSLANLGPRGPGRRLAGARA